MIDGVILQSEVGYNAKPNVPEFYPNGIIKQPNYFSSVNYQPGAATAKYSLIETMNSNTL